MNTSNICVVFGNSLEHEIDVCFAKRARDFESDVGILAMAEV
jgi:hypothetical protein